MGREGFKLTFELTADDWAKIEECSAHIMVEATLNFRTYRFSELLCSLRRQGPDFSNKETTTASLSLLTGKFVYGEALKVETYEINGQWAMTVVLEIPKHYFWKYRQNYLEFFRKVRVYNASIGLQRWL